jgi:tetratricopeptide (TPR) repeat protein
LGVILHQLATGRHPMPLVTDEERLGGKSAPVNHPWNSVIQRCLDPDPEERFPSADKVALALAPPTRRWLLAGAVAAALSLFAAGVTYWSTAAPVESVRLAVLPLRAGAAEAPLRDKTYREVIQRVSQLKGDQRKSLETVSLDGILRGRVDSVEKAQADLGATHVLHGTIEKENDQMKLRALLTDARSKVNVKEWTAIYGPGEERYLPVALASMVTGALRLPPVAAALNPSARSDYTAGLLQLRRDSSIAAAVASFERAVQADPDSPLAYAGLAEAQWFQYFTTRQRLWLERSAESARQAERRNSDFAQIHRVAGLHLANGGFYEHASAEYRRAIELEPGDAENYRRLGQVYEKNSQKAEALTAFQTAVTLQPDYHRTHLELGAYHYNRGDYLRAVEPLKIAVDLAPDEPNVRFALGGTYIYLGMYAEAEQQLRVAVAREEASKPLHSLGLALMYQARDKDAIEYFLRALRRTPDSFLSCMYLGIAYRRTNQSAEAALANRRGLELTEGEMAKNPRDGYVRAIRGYFAALLGDRIRAESETAQALTLAPDDAETRWVALLTYEFLGLRNASLSVLGSSSRSQLMDISRWPDLAPLHHDSRFLELLANSNQN